MKYVVGIAVDDLNNNWSLTEDYGTPIGWVSDNNSYEWVEKYGEWRTDPQWNLI